MGANTKALKSRIRSVDSTLHLTRAMGLVASSKIRRATEAMNNGRQYAHAFGDVVDLLTACPESARSPYMQPRETQRTRLIVIAGDRGLAGGYNANVFRLTDSLEKDAIIPIGKRACDRYHGEFHSSEHYPTAEAAKLARTLCEDYLKGEYDRLGIVSTRYESMMTQVAEVTWVLPIEKREHEGSVGVVFEPDEQTILNSTVPDYVAGMIMRAIRESFACEVAARRMAMDSAGKNAQTMIDNLQLQYNRARQGAITQEITEIVAGSGQ
ncbi:MAG: ATP synthase F1 subunit gamma [Christensenellaceae bacterium]|nr:ATP synthase F1 subunit gamma [Christensenellaceae bacterium]